MPTTLEQANQEIIRLNEIIADLKKSASEKVKAWRHKHPEQFREQRKRLWKKIKSNPKKHAEHKRKRRELYMRQYRNDPLFQQKEKARGARRTAREKQNKLEIGLYGLKAKLD